MLRILPILLLAFVAATAGANDTAAPDIRDPMTIIGETTTHILQTVDRRREEFTADPSLLRELVNQDLLPLIDIEYSARLILGKAGRGISEEQLDEFARVMSEILLVRYADGLLRFNSDEQIEVLPARGKNTDKLTRVRTRFRLDNGASVPVDYAFRKTEHGWKAFDVTVEGISYVLTFRNQIAPRVTAEGIEKVTADIRAGNISLEG